MAEARRGKDIDRYTEAVENLRMICPDDRDAVLDTDWMERTKTANRAETQRLEAELKGYKNNLIKESIRVSVHIQSCATELADWLLLIDGP